MSKTRIGVVGAGGRMGRMLIEATLKDENLALGAAFDVPGSPALGKTAGELVGMAWWAFDWSFPAFTANIVLQLYNVEWARDPARV